MSPVSIRAGRGSVQGLSTEGTRSVQKARECHVVYGWALPFDTAIDRSFWKLTKVRDAPFQLPEKV